MISAKLAYNVISPVWPAAISVTYSVEPSTKLQPKNCLFAFVAAAIASGRFLTSYLVGLLDAFLPPFNS